MKKVQHIVSLALVWVLLTCMVQSSFAEKSRVLGPNLSSSTFSTKSPQNTFASIHSKRFERQAINIGWGKRGKKIIQMRVAAGICREDFLPVSAITVTNAAPRGPNYSLLRFSCFSHRGPPSRG